MASSYLQRTMNGFSSTSLPDYGVQPSSPPVLDGVPSDQGEISDSDDDYDLPSVKKIMARVERVHPQTWPPESVIDLTGESDDDVTEVSLHRKYLGS